MIFAKYLKEINKPNYIGTTLPNSNDIFYPTNSKNEEQTISDISRIYESNPSSNTIFNNVPIKANENSFVANLDNSLENEQNNDDLLFREEIDKFHDINPCNKLSESYPKENPSPPTDNIEKETQKENRVQNEPKRKNELIKVNKEQKKNKKKRIHHNDNTRKEAIKKPMIIAKDIIEKYGKIKLNINFDTVFGTSFSQNRAALQLKVYQILTTNTKNKYILSNAKPDQIYENEYYNLLKSPYEFIYQNYINDNNFLFQIDDIPLFKTLKDVIKEKEEVLKDNKKKYDEKEIAEFVKTSKEYFDNLKSGNFKERQPQNFLVKKKKSINMEEKEKRRTKRKIFLVFKAIREFEEFNENGVNGA